MVMLRLIDTCFWSAIVIMSSEIDITCCMKAGGSVSNQMNISCLMQTTSVANKAQNMTEVKPNLVYFQIKLHLCFNVKHCIIFSTLFH